VQSSVDCGELVVATPPGPLQWGDELDVDLHPVSRLLLLVAFPALAVPLVALRARQSVHVETLEDAPDPRDRDRDVVVALEVHLDLLRPEVVVGAQVDDLRDDLGRRRPGTDLGALGPVPQTIGSELLVATHPAVVGLPADPVIAPRLSHVAGDLTGMPDDR
jgi:hypothetical protein